MTTTNMGLYGPEAVLGQTGTPAVSTPVTVFLHGTTTDASLFTDNTGTASASNPVTTDTFGNLAFYATPGLYDLSFTVGGVATTLTVLVEPWFIDSTIPTGTIFDYAGTSIPTGWLNCDGSAVSRTTYAALFAALDTTWGNGDGSTTFNLPDLRGRVTVGVGSVGTNSQPTVALGAVGGEQNHTLIAAEAPAVTLPAPDTYLAAGTSYQAIVTMPTSTGNVYAIPTTGNAGAGAILVEEINTTWNEATTDDGGGDGHNTMQPYAAVTKMIKA